MEEKFTVYSHVNKITNTTYVGITKRDQMSNSHKGQTPSTPKKVAMLDMEGNILRTFKSIKEASEYIGKPKLHSKISNCCRGSRNKTCGYKWKYIE